MPERRFATLGETFNPRSNSLNTMRLIFANLVIVAHSFDIGGFKGKPVLGDFVPGAFAVAAFFVASGYLITQSRERNSIWRYSWARILRIFPAFWVCLLVTAFGFAAITGAVRGGWTLHSALNYIVRNWTLVIHQWTIGDTLAQFPFKAWDGSLWTLAPEFACYVAIGLFLLVPFFRNRWCVFAFFASATVLAAFVKVGNLNTYKGLLPLLPFFLAGATLYHFRSRLPMSRALLAVSVVTVAVSASAHWGMVVAPLPLAYAVMYLGTFVPRGVERIGDGTVDISYGVYIYAFPIAQMLVLAGVHKLGVIALMAATAVVTVVPATASWFLIEKPAMKFKRLPWPPRPALNGPSRHRPAA
jgi:peptidoglycan/LPS O-acetylase OafA/YrhL